MLPGCNVMIASRNGDRLKSTTDELTRQLSNNSDSPRIEYAVCNIRQEDQVTSYFRRFVIILKFNIKLKHYSFC